MEDVSRESGSVILCGEVVSRVLDNDGMKFKGLSFESVEALAGGWSEVVGAERSGWFGDFTGHDEDVDVNGSAWGGNGVGLEESALCMGHPGCFQR